MAHHSDPVAGHIENLRSLIGETGMNSHDESLNALVAPSDPSLAVPLFEDDCHTEPSS